MDVACESSAAPTGASAERPERAPTLGAGKVCVDVGYLCAELGQSGVVRIQRWKDFEGTLVVHIPLPDFEDPATARELQRAAAQGLRAWNGQPFPILADLRGDRDPRFAVRWSRSLGGSELGVARTRWSPSTGLTVVSIELATRNPFNPTEPANPRQVRLTAAHEMGHALGLPHSDARRDIMYPSNTATSMSAQDYRTIEVLYRMEDGTEIRR
jgi:Matrixin